jgi:hypothetical protein
MSQMIPFANVKPTEIPKTSLSVLISLAALCLIHCSDQVPIDSSTLDASVDQAIDASPYSGDAADAFPIDDADATTGLVFSEPVLVANTPGNAKLPAIAALNDGFVQIVWHDFSRDPAGLYQAEGKAGQWEVRKLTLDGGKKSTSAKLLVENDKVHMLWEVWESEPTLYHAIYQEDWSEPQKVAVGKTVSSTFDAQGNIHALFFSQKFPTHAIYDGKSWSMGDVIPLDHTYINTFRLAVVNAPAGIEVALSTSPGGTGYQMRRWKWAPMTGWGDMQTLVESLHLSSDDPHGASDSKGLAHWVWTEQSPLDPNLIGIATMKNTDASYHWVSAEVGFAMGPVMTIPPDDLPVVAWITPRETIAVDRHPYGTPQELTSHDATIPSITSDADGYSHLVFSARDDQGIQQIWYSSNRPAGPNR